MAGLFSILKQFIADREFQRLSLFVIFVLIVGAAFYSGVEGWGMLDSVYFCVTTLTTVGYGDFAPETSAGKMFTILYIIVGIGVLLGYINVVAKIAIKHRFGMDTIIEKTKDLGGKTIELGRKVHMVPPAKAVEAKEEEEEMEEKERPPPGRPRQYIPLEKIPKRRFK
jgi:hypothetical protein